MSSIFIYITAWDTRRKINKGTEAPPARKLEHKCDPEAQYRVAISGKKVRHQFHLEKKCQLFFLTDKIIYFFLSGF